MIPIHCLGGVVASDISWRELSGTSDAATLVKTSMHLALLDANQPPLKQRN